MNKRDFHYVLPPELIAQRPLENRSASRLLILDKTSGAIKHGFFADIADILNEGDCLVINNTKVIPARLMGQNIISAGARITHRPVEILLLNNRGDDIREAMVKPGKRAKEGHTLTFGSDLLTGEIIKVLENGNRLIKFTYNGIFEEILDTLGQMPLPPYIYEKLEDKDRYQTIYAKEAGSAAAPTAGLHFTEDILSQITKKGIKIANVTLHVGLGTFRQVKTEKITDHQMHQEHYILEPSQAEIINQTKAAGGRIIAVGTTSVRTLESCATRSKTKIVTPKSGHTSIFIYPGFEFKTIDGLITNFHLPESTLIMLVCALAGHQNTLNAYHQAILQKYRFFSFGDAMLII
jgi:S-adenosylmethionine:tRNA ribosyltransferase-isomerase